MSDADTLKTPLRVVEAHGIEETGGSKRRWWCYEIRDAHGMLIAMSTDDEYAAAIVEAVNGTARAAPAPGRSR